jgi:hypothetical protein
MIAKIMYDQGSPLWKGIWSSWLEVRPGLRKTAPVFLEEIMRQPLFFNSQIKSLQGEM